MTMYRPAQCFACQHRHRPRPGSDPLTTSQLASCDAFPAGIPAAIAVDMADHREPIEGDHGIQFEFNEGDPTAHDRFGQWQAWVDEQR